MGRREPENIVSFVIYMDTVFRTYYNMERPETTENHWKSVRTNKYKYFIFSGVVTIVIIIIYILFGVQKT